MNTISQQRMDLAWKCLERMGARNWKLPDGTTLWDAVKRKPEFAAMLVRMAEKMHDTIRDDNVQGDVNGLVR